MTTNDVLHAMELAELAYLEDQPMLSDSVMTVIDDDQTGVQCYIRKTEDLLDITFRGSNSAKDWRHNLMFWKKCIPYGNTCSKIRVHTGFFFVFKSKQVRNRLLNMGTPELRRFLRSGAVRPLCGGFAVQLPRPRHRGDCIWLPQDWQPRISKIL